MLHRPLGLPRAWQLLELALELPDGPLRLWLGAPSRPATLACLAAPARQIADAIVSRTLAAARAGGACVPCRKGCDACCRYLVPVSPPEALDIAHRVASMPSARRAAVQRNFAAAAAALLEAGKGAPTSAAALAAANIPCPLLADGGCLLYAARPLACREHGVISPPQACVPRGDGTVASTPLTPPVSVATALMRVASQAQGCADEAVALPLALAWCDANARSAAGQYDAADLAAHLVAALTQAAAQAR